MGRILRYCGAFRNWRGLGCPLVVGTSRKVFCWLGAGGQGASHGPLEKRLWGTTATVTASVLGGAHTVRAHDVAVEMAEVVRVADAIARAH